MAWTDDLREAFRDPVELAAHLGIDLADLPPIRRDGRFPLLVPRSFAARMVPGDPRDPLLRQVWPEADEERVAPGESVDPVGDGSARRSPGLLAKYAGRALLVATGACAVHCRYCFRQNFPYAEAPSGTGAWKSTLASLAALPDLEEVLLSGGDPLMLPDSVLRSRIADLAGLGVGTLRLHTRLPVVLPSRVDAGLVEVLAGIGLRLVVVLHANHPAEVSPEVTEACARLRDAGAVLLNQSVLLAGVNDSAEVLARLSRALWGAGILPYYLHALDPVVGSSRFHVADEQALELVEAVRTRLPGYLVPRLVREIEGEPSKTPLVRP